MSFLQNYHTIRYTTNIYIFGLKDEAFSDTEGRYELLKIHIPQPLLKGLPVNDTGGTHGVSIGLDLLEYSNTVGMGYKVGATVKATFYWTPDNSSWKPDVFLEGGVEGGSNTGIDYSTYIDILTSNVFKGGYNSAIKLSYVHDPNNTLAKNETGWLKPSSVFKGSGSLLPLAGKVGVQAEYDLFNEVLEIGIMGQTSKAPLSFGVQGGGKLNFYQYNSKKP